MKLFLDNHEAVIDWFHEPSNYGAEKGEIIAHHKKVNKIYFYKSHWLNDQEVFFRVELTESMVIDLADAIIKIKSETADLPFDNLPF